MTGHTSHFKVVHNKHANTKRRLVGEDEVEARFVEEAVQEVGARNEVEDLEKRSEVVKRADTTMSDACLTGAFYTAPTIGSTHDALQPLTVSWDASLNCLSGPLVDIYLYAPHNTSPRIHLWSRVKASRGKMDVEIMPRWWNATNAEELQIQIVENGKAPFLSGLPAGPVFTATYAAPSDGSVPTVADTSVVDIGETKVNDDLKASSSKGKIAAGILIPLLFIALAGGFYLRWKRAKAQASRKAWTEAVDKRMSTISTDWKSVTGKGAQEAIRKSFAGGNRASTFSFNAGVGGGPGGMGRPSSQWANGEWNAAGGDVNEKGEGQGGKTTTGVGLRNPGTLSGGERQSRVSFADGPRPSGESRRTKVWRDSDVPPVPSLPVVATPASSSSDGVYNGTTYTQEEEGSGAMSPTQTQGAFSLTPEAIRARIAAGRARSASNSSSGSVGGYANGGGKGQGGGMKGSVDIGGDETAAALAMMRTGAAGASTDDLLFAAPAAPAPAYSSPLASNAPVHGHSYSGGNGMSSPTVSSPVMASIPMPAMQAMPAAMMSPDDMLRAYAERKKSMSAAPASSASSSLSHSAYGVVPGSTGATTYSNVNGVVYPAMPQAAAGTGGGRMLFNGSTVSPQGTGERKERTPSLGFAPGEYDPNFRFEQDAGDAYGGMGEGDIGNAAGRGAWRS